jgi:protease-4
MQAVYDDFVNQVAKGRGMTYEQAEPLAHGRVWTGAQAKQRGLVDELGGLDKAVELAKTAANITGDHQLVVYPKQKNFFEALAEGMEGASIRSNPDAMKILEHFVDEADDPKVMVMMPQLEVE